MTTTFNGATVGPANVRHLAVRFGLSSHLICGGTIVVRDANDNEIFHQSRVYLSLTRGDAWVGRELTDGDVNRVAFSPAEPLICYAVTSTGNVYKSSGGWTRRLAHTAANRPSPMYITGLALSWTNPDVLYISFGGYGGPRIMRSDDAGAHWTDRSGTAGDDLPVIPITSIVMSPVCDDVAYVSTDIGVFRTQDGGATWQDFNDGWQWQDVPRIIVTELALRRSVQPHPLREHARAWRLPARALVSRATAGPLTSRPDQLCSLHSGRSNVAWPRRSPWTRSSPFSPVSCSGSPPSRCDGCGSEPS